MIIIKNFRVNEEAITSRTQKLILTKEKEVDGILSDIKTFIIDSAFGDSTVRFIDNIIEDQIDVTFLVFSSDSLIYWSNNSAPVFDLYSNNPFEFNLAQLSNGVYDIRKVQVSDYIIAGLICIRHEYAYENQYLNNGFSEFLTISSDVSFNKDKGAFNIYNSENSFLFSLNFPKRFNYTSIQIFLISLFYLLAYLFLIAAIYHAYLRLSKIFKNQLLLFVGFTFDVVIVRLLIFYFRYPIVLYSSGLFSPEFFASSFWIPSMGDLLLHLIALFAIAYKFNESFHFSSAQYQLSRTFKIIISILIFTFTFIVFRFLAISLESLVYNSGVSFDLNDISGIDQYSIIGFTSFGLLILIFVFITFKLAVFNAKLHPSLNQYLPIIIITHGLFYGICALILGCDGLIILFLFVYQLIIYFSSGKESHSLHFSIPLLLIILFTLFSTYLLYQFNQHREREIRKLIARDLTEQRDPIAEYKFDENYIQILRDSTLHSLISNYPFQENEELGATTDYIIRNYFSNYWSKYDVMVTICDSIRSLNLRPDDLTVNCNSYFDDIINSFGINTGSSNLYYIDYPLEDDYYLGVINYPHNDDYITIYIEFFSKSIPKGIGYPELLKDYGKENKVNWSKYSYARYEDKTLVFRLGRYFYSMNLDNYIRENDTAVFFNQNGYNHFFYPINGQTSLIVTTKNHGLLDITAPFSYISIFYGLLSFIVYLILKNKINFNYSNQGFKQRLQISISLLIIISFFLVGLSSSAFIISLNNNKNYSILSEKAHSVLIELEHKLAQEDDLTPDMEMYLSDLLYKFSMVFFTDVNLYETNGTLLATSRAEIFNRGLVSTKMNAQAYRSLHDLNKSIYIHKEAIGNYNYLSAYLPLVNFDNKLIAYINLPYFAKQDELTNEISTFLVAFINIYVILIAIALYTALFVSNYISKPIQLLKGKISTLRLGQKEQKIDWHKNDEIGGLVEEYNRMVDELMESAELLAKSERESAWREMARQIAHEIKNPLTPMKLSVQFLQKAWDEKLPDWEDRLKRFTKTIVEQIDSLSVIASAFSDFANMPKSNFTKTELTEIAENAIGLFKDTTKINFDLIKESEHFVIGDKEQLLRVFNNLIKNSLQAINDKQNGQITITITREGTMHKVTFSDNGPGIPSDQKDKVFYPNFTTKSGGTGLGLAMVKNIILNTGGLITFKSSENGTTFTILIPAFKEGEIDLINLSNQ